MIHLRGMAWNHTRGAGPLWVTSSAFHDYHPEIEISWDIRSLSEFGEGGISNIVKDYDLLMVDHPFIAHAAEQKLFHPAENFLNNTALLDIAGGSIGYSWESYEWKGRHWALPVDAACQVSAYRADIFKEKNLTLPVSMEEVLELASRTGAVAMPMRSMGLLCAFFTLCSNYNAPLFSDPNLPISVPVVEKVIDFLQRLAKLVVPESRNSFPTSLLGRMTQTNDIWYIPITFGYSLYSMAGYAPSIVDFASVVPLNGYDRRGGTIGGVGIGISSYSAHPEIAFKYASWISGSSCQQTLYSYSGGQPAHCQAWDNRNLDKMYNGFFSGTRTGLEQGYLRPKFPDYHYYQSLLGGELQQVVFEGKAEAVFMDLLNTVNEKKENKI
jgi:multiple sugar transport system substrate-binding protein